MPLEFSQIHSQAFTDTKSNDTMKEYHYVVEEVQLANAGKYQCKAVYEDENVEGGSGGTTYSNEESIVVLGKVTGPHFDFLPFSSNFLNFSRAFTQISPELCPHPKTRRSLATARVAARWSWRRCNPNRCLQRRLPCNQCYLANS